jgi:hypothetical protein
LFAKQQNCANVSLCPLSLAFFLGQVLALVNLVMALEAQSSDQIVICLNASPFATAPITVSRLNAIVHATTLTGETRH